MNTDTRYDDATLQATLQAAIDAAILEVSRGSLITSYHPDRWDQEAPDRLSLARALLARLPEPANAELDVFRSFFGRASVVLQQLDGLGDNGDTENFIERLQKLLEWKCTAAEKTAVESLMQSQGLTALQVLRQALRHYQMAMLGGQASLEAGIKRMEAVSVVELERVWDASPCKDDGLAIPDAFNAVRARLIAAAREGQPIRQPSQAEYYLPKIPNPLSQPAVEAAKPAYVGYMTDEMPADPYADKPKAEPVLVPLDASDIRATDEFRLIQSPDTIYTVIRWDSRCILFQSIGLENYSDISRHYLRRQHGSEEWKHCTKKKK
jgi:hypothetical protein